MKSPISRLAFPLFQRVFCPSKRTGKHNKGSRLGRRGGIAGALLILIAAGCGGSNSGGGSAPPDVSLAVLEITGVELDQAFDPELLNYTASATWLTNEVTITAEAADTQALVKINGVEAPAEEPATQALQVGTNAVQIDVESGLAQKLYSIEITRDSSASFRELASLTSEPARRESHVGTSLSASGATFIAGAPFDDGNATGVNAVPIDLSLQDSGAAYVFSRDEAGAWVQRAYLKASNADEGDRFGESTAVFGDTVVVGAPFESSAATEINGNEEDDSAPGAGAAYVFVRGDDGNWTQQAYLKASDAMAEDRFGNTVAIDGNTIAVSARRLSVGVIYLFERDASGTWTQQTAVSGEDGAGDVAFGDALGLDADTLAVGAKWHGSSSGGAVYVFRKADSGSWAQESLLVGSNTGADDNFGGSLTLDGDTLAIGAPQEDSGATGVGGDEDDDSAPFSGATYVFVRNDSGIWQQQAYLKASNAEANDSFGYSVAVRGDWLAVGADNEASAASGADGDQSDNTLPGSGAVYLFARDSDGIWSQQLYLKAANPQFNVRMGRRVAFTHKGLVVAAPFEDGIDATSLDTGVVHVFQ